MSQTCTITSCNRTSRALCHCCQQNVCVIHLNEHNDMLNSRLTPLVSIVNTLGSRLLTLNIKKTVDNGRQKLERWRIDSHQRIDQFFEQKCQELDQLVTEKVDEQREEISRLQSKMTTLIREQQATRQDIYELTSTIDHLEKEINNIEENFAEINTRPLTLENNLVSIRGINQEQYDLSVLSSIYKTINRPEGSYGILASNDRNLLIHQAPDLCLINKDLSIFKRISWRHGTINDACWSATLDRFILINEKHIFLLNENTMSIEKVQTREKRRWLTCTCSDKFLFLSTNEWGSSITKISFDPSKKFDQQWESPDMCKIDEYIDVITYNKRKLAMIIRNSSSNIIRMEVRTSETLDRIWSVPLDVLWNPNKPYHCCPFIDEDWLIADYETGRLLQMTKAGRIKSIIPYNTVPYCATQFGPNILAVSTKGGINFHHLNYKKTYTIFVL
jgi:polyhydroxyalkanoate synthesis regulator phasin